MMQNFRRINKANGGISKCKANKYIFHRNVIRYGGFLTFKLTPRIVDTPLSLLQQWPTKWDTILEWDTMVSAMKTFVYTTFTGPGQPVRLVRLPPYQILS